MNTSNFQTEANRLACKAENDLRSICGVGELQLGPAVPVPPLPGQPLLPLTPWEYKYMQTLLAAAGRDGFTVEQRAILDGLVKRYMANGGSDPYNAPIPVEPEGPGVDPTPPSSGSFATHSIDNIWDLLNFIKASAVILLGSSTHPNTFLAANIIMGAAFLYATRKSIFKFL